MSPVYIVHGHTHKNI